ncbi:MAG: UDP-N-acetylmuramoyl-tripeptide--D-alanyl-D-alanine ligase, partial [Tepidiformaceae bacterium]
SRNVRPGDLFTAFPGENADGNRFVADALKNGAVAALCERAPAVEWPDKTIVVAPDATRAIGELAHEWRQAWGGRVVGITGTVGKTTAKELVAATLAARFETHKSEGNFNSREGLPLALMSVRRQHAVSVLEMGMDSAGEIAYLCGIAEPEIGVVLNIGLTHVSKLGSIDAIAVEKLSLARWLPASGTAVLNADDERVAAGVSGLRCRVLTFGRGATAALRAESVESRGLFGTTFRARLGEFAALVESPLPGAHVVPAALAALGVCIALGLSLDEAAAAVTEARTLGHLRVVTVADGITVIDDRYNASPASMRGALEMLATLDGRRIAFLGRMAELGDYEESEHRKAGEVAARCCDVLVTVGAVCLALADAARAAGHADVRWFETKEAAAENVAHEMRPGDTVLVKASRGEAFETILPLLGVAA